METGSNKSELIQRMNRLGCFHAANETSNICKELLNLLVPDNKSNNDLHLQDIGDDYSTLNPAVYSSYALAIILNCALLWMMHKDPLKKFRTPSSLLIANLAISDLIGACLSLAIEGESSKTGHKPSDSTTLYLPWLVAATAQASYQTVMLVSMDRYAAIAYPFRYRVLVVTKYTLLVVFVCWLLAFTISTPMFFIPQLHKILTGSEIYAGNTFVLTAIILVLYPLTHASLRRQRKQVLDMNANNQKLRTKKLRIEKNFANAMFLVCFFLIFFTSPYVVTFFFTVSKCNSCILNEHFLNTWMYFRVFFAMHFGVNPIIYAWRLPCYRKSLCTLLQSNCCGRAVLLVRGNRAVPSNSAEKLGSRNLSGTGSKT